MIRNVIRNAIDNLVQRSRNGLLIPDRKGTEWRVEVSNRILGCYETYLYTIPSFSVITVIIRRIKYQCIQPDQSTKVVDGFIRDDPSLDSRLYPIEASVAIGLDNACIVKVSCLHRAVG